MLNKPGIALFNNGMTIIKVNSCMVSMELKGFIGTTAEIQLNSPNFVRVYYVFHSVPEVPASYIIENGIYHGTHVPNALFYINTNIQQLQTGNDHISLIAIKDDKCRSAVLTFVYSQTQKNCLFSHVSIRSYSDYNNGCIAIDGIAPQSGIVYSYVKIQLQDMPDHMTMVQSGNTIGYYNHNEFTMKSCNLDEKMPYTLYLMQSDGQCFTSIYAFNFTTQAYSDLAKWGRKSVINQRIGTPSTRQTGVKYRRYGGIELEQEELNSELVSGNGVVLGSIPKQVYKDNEDNLNIAVRWRKVKRSKNNSVLIKFLLVGSGETYILATTKQDKTITVEDIVKNGMSIGYMSDEIIRVKLFDLDAKDIYIYVGIVLNQKTYGPFITAVK
ncbi:hypothetical protein WA158_002190 [Blastocystis sp. Blastoise]